MAEILEHKGDIRVALEEEVIKRIVGDDDKKVAQWIEANEFQNAVTLREILNDEDIIPLVDSGRVEDYETAINMVISKFNERIATLSHAA